MVRFLIVVVLASFGYLSYTKYFPKSQAATKGAYSLATVEQQPIPKKEFFSLWREVALESCTNAKDNHNITPEECREKVGRRSDSCELSSSVNAPATIDNKNISKKVGREFLECVTPYVFCNGVEVKTEAHAREHCR